MGGRAACVGAVVREDVSGKQPLILGWATWVVVVEQWVVGLRSGDGLSLVVRMVVVVVVVVITMTMVWQDWPEGASVTCVAVVCQDWWDYRC